MAEQGWHREDIKAAIRKRGATLRGLECRHGFSMGAFNKALTRRFPNVHAIIAGYIGVERQIIWPQFYDASGAPRGKCRRDLHRQPLLEAA